MGWLDRLLGRPSPADFAARLIRAIHEAGETSEYRYEKAEHRILRIADGEPSGVIHLDNIYRRFRELPRSGRPEYLRTCVRAALAPFRELPEDFESAGPDLRPRLWARATIEKLRLEESATALDDMIHEPVGEHILAGLVFDWPEAVQSLNGSNLKSWNVSFYEAMELARTNLEEGTFGYARIGESLFAFLSGDSYDATRILLIDRIRALEVHGRHIAMVPNRDMLLITGSEDVDGLGLMIEMAGKALKEPYSLSGGPLVLRDDAWTDWVPPPDHALYSRFQNVHVRWLGPEYAAQKETLTDLYEKRKLELFVSSYSVVQKPQGDLVSYCVWGNDIDSLLPVTQKIVFMREDCGGPVALGDWDRVREIVGDLMEPTEAYPARYRVRRFPDQAMLDAIGLGSM